ncbi:MAG: hypothetical protein GY948_02125 [Alphaproteobacteria bacterium]|nr:hypothetical protein [Alphaproteobacteria bacterium]
MIRKALFAIAAVATIAGAATTAQAGSYGHGGYYSHGYEKAYQPSYRYIRKCHRVKVGHRKVYDPYTYGYFFKPVYKRHCKRVRVYH